MAGFHDKDDYIHVESLKWFKDLVALIQCWFPDIDTKEDVLDTIPHQENIAGIPSHMWMDKVIKCISVL